MTENHKQKGVLERVFAVSPKGNGLLAASCIASVLGMALSLAPYLSVYFICKYFLLGAAGSTAVLCCGRRLPEAPLSEIWCSRF